MHVCISLLIVRSNVLRSTKATWLMLVPCSGVGIGRGLGRLRDMGDGTLNPFLLHAFLLALETSRSAVGPTAYPLPLARISMPSTLML